MPPGEGGDLPTPGPRDGPLPVEVDARKERVGEGAQGGRGILHVCADGRATKKRPSPVRISTTRMLFLPDRDEDDARTPIDPYVWGPPLWDILFSFAYRVPAGKVSHLLSLLDTLRSLLPCKYCRDSYAAFFARLPPVGLRSGEDVAQWLWTCKDAVNRKLEKPYVAYASVRLRYTTYQSCTSPQLVAQVLLLLASNVDAASLPSLSQAATSLSSLLRCCVGGGQGVASLLDGSDLVREGAVSTSDEAKAAAEAVVRGAHEVSETGGGGSVPFVEGAWRRATGRGG